ncbi:DNA-binding protein [Agromyces lapidis]|uniref:DNA-binding protein n=1 Tax=Agromyces lapidis TaxID=279574 RepID=A0ABV5SQS2_9MICO|nr:DNA-binding protein [Agromyces lapidis]
MIVITADQVSSRTRADLAGSERDRIQRAHGDRLLLPVARNAGDEIQLLTNDARTAVDVVLELTRHGEWSVGIGCGSVREPLPDDIREASGEAFFAARDAVERAKKSTPRLAVEAPGSPLDGDAAQLEALFKLALILRERRSAQGWEVYDRIVAGALQSDIADELGVSAPAISSRMKSANIRAELDAVPALARLLETLDASTGARHP